MTPTIKELKKIHHKEGIHESFFVRFMLKTISIYVTKFFLYFPITPNIVTTLGIFITITATVLFSFGNYTYSIIAAFLIWMAYMFDAVDGEVARYKKMGSIKGNYYDDISYFLIETLPIIGIAIGQFNRFQSPDIFYAALLFLFSISFLRIISNLRFKILFSDVLKAGKRIKSNGGKLSKEKAVARKKGFIRRMLAQVKLFVNFIFKLDGFITLLVIASLFDRVHWVLFFYAVAYPILLVFTILFQIHGRFDEYIEETLNEIPFHKFK